MIHARLSEWRSIPGLESNGMWSTAFEWLETYADQAEEGTHPLSCEGFYARIMSYGLITRELARFEGHRHTSDVQFSIDGAEGIEFAPPGSLVAQNDYDPTKDAEHYITPETIQGWVNNCQGHFTIFLPGELHMPKLIVHECQFVKKAVIKIPMDTLRH